MIECGDLGYNEDGSVRNPLATRLEGVRAYLGKVEENPREYMETFNVGFNSYGFPFTESYLELFVGESDNGVGARRESGCKITASLGHLFPFIGHTTSNTAYLPVCETTGVTVSTADVIHRWGVPALGVKMDAVPGRINILSVTPMSVGVLSGNCYELCGQGHRVIPIDVIVMKKEAYYKLLRDLETLKLFL